MAVLRESLKEDLMETGMGLRMGSLKETLKEADWEILMAKAKGIHWGYLKVPLWGL
jgi:hypothetical protein